MSRCIYCNKDTQTYIMVKSSKKDYADEYPCCSEKCFNKAESFFKYVHSTMPIFTLLIICSLVLILSKALEFNNNNIFISCGFILLGITILVFPFSNGIEFMGVRKSKIIVRILGIVVVCIGALFWLL